MLVDSILLAAIVQARADRKEPCHVVGATVYDTFKPRRAIKLRYHPNRPDMESRADYARDCLTFAAMLGRELPNLPSSECAALVSSVLVHADRLQTLAETECNRSLGTFETAEQERRADALRALLTRHGIRVHVDGDPRGYVVKLHVPSGAHNTWGGAESGWGVPA